MPDCVECPHLHKNFGELTDITYNSVLNKKEIDQKFEPIRHHLLLWSRLDRFRICLGWFMTDHSCPNTALNRSRIDLNHDLSLRCVIIDCRNKRLAQFVCLILVSVDVYSAFDTNSQSCRRIKTLFLSFLRFHFRCSSRAVECWVICLVSGLCLVCEQPISAASAIDRLIN